MSGTPCPECHDPRVDVDPPDALNHCLRCGATWDGWERVKGERDAAIATSLKLAAEANEAARLRSAARALVAAVTEFAGAAVMRTASSSPSVIAEFNRATNVLRGAVESVNALIEGKAE